MDGGANLRPQTAMPSIARQIHKGNGASGRGVPRSATRAAGYALLWWILTGGEAGSWVIGLPAVVGAGVASHLLRSGSTGGWHLPGLARFLPFFLWRSLVGGADVARRALRPRLTLAPALLNYRWRLPPGPWRVAFANSVSLLPGTLSVDLRGHCLIVHVLDQRQPIRAELCRLEELIARLYGRSLPHEKSERRMPRG